MEGGGGLIYTKSVKSLFNFFFYSLIGAVDLIDELMSSNGEDYNTYITNL